MSLKKLSAEFEKHMPKGVVNATANVLSAPAQIKSSLARKRSKLDSQILKDTRAYDGMPDFTDDGSVTEGFKVRSVAQDVKDRLTKKYKKSK